jgi:hypothetical protein
MRLTDLSLESPLLVAILNGTYRAVGGHEADASTVIQKMNSLALEFFNATLKGQGSFNSAGTY